MEIYNEPLITWIHFVNLSLFLGAIVLLTIKNESEKFPYQGILELCPIVNFSGAEDPIGRIRWWLVNIFWFSVSVGIVVQMIEERSLPSEMSLKFKIANGILTFGLALSLLKSVLLGLILIKRKSAVLYNYPIKTRLLFLLPFERFRKKISVSDRELLKVDLALCSALFYVLNINFLALGLANVLFSSM